SPPQNHYWHVALYPNARGLTTSPIPCGETVFEMQFDFLAHVLDIWTSGGERRVLPLRAETVASFYGRVMEAVREVGVVCAIQTKPQEMEDITPFEEDHRPRVYDREYVRRFWRILLSTSQVLQEFRTGFAGKCSPVHFFWGSFDLAHTRFSGRLAPPRKGVISGPSYSHEEYSAGFWPGGGAIDGAAFYAYATPQPAGYEGAAVRPAAAGWNATLREFILMYDDVRRADDPRGALREFLDSTYEAAARLGNWDRAALEREWK
ncbi:MAG TPA: DUF5996 family protein, partial [Candidatus Sulfopaludibacter sp.]|nr:DUF5996 family protein [Candidatus Sulfopaludibacter sp.]